MRIRNAFFTAAAGTAAAGTLVAAGGVLLTRAAMRRFRVISLQGKVALVTGASRGLGLAIAQELAREGARLVICARDEQELRWAQSELQAMGAQVLAVPCDVGDKDQVHRMFEQIRARYGMIDVLVNNAGTISVGPIHSQTLADFEEAMRVMYWGQVYTILEALPEMLRRQEGSIANISSIGGRVSIPHLLPYCAAKFAAAGLSEGLHAELAKDGIRVTTVIPGLMRTGSHVNAYFKGDHRKEFAWFSVGASTPVTAMSARRAAKKIVNAIKRGKSDLVLSWQAKSLAFAHGVAPGTVANVLGVTNRVMPGSRSERKERFTGKESRNIVSESFLTKPGRSAGEELHQYPEKRGQDGSGTASSPEALLAD